MSNFNLREIIWHDILIRVLLVIVTVAIVVWIMPHDNTNLFHVEQGKPWKYAELTAPFDFPIYKAESVVKHERDSIMKEYQPYYKYNVEIERQMVHKFTTDYADGIPNVPDDYISIISNRLHSLYQQGIMESKEYETLRSDTTNMINIVNKKQATSVSILEVYSAKRAYEQLFMDEKLIPMRAALQKCNLNNYIIPNLTYDRQRSETSRNELMASIPLASGLVQKGQKIVDRGEIVTDRTYRIIDSYVRENDRRNQDKTQILYVSVLMICFTLYLSLYRKDYFENSRNAAMLYTFIVIFALLTALFVRNTFIHVYILPYAMVPIFIRIFMDSRTANMLQHPFEFTVVELVAGLVAITSLRELSKRSQLFRTALVITLACVIVNLAFDWTKATALSQIDYSIYNYLIFNGIALLFAYPLLYLIEKTFGFTSDITLIELSNTNSPLLRRMSEIAPGTFNHSIQGAYRCPLPRHRQTGQPHILYREPVGHRPSRDADGHRECTDHHQPCHRRTEDGRQRRTAQGHPRLHCHTPRTGQDQVLLYTLQERTS